MKHKRVVPREDYAPDTYPNFINGPSYLLTAEAASAILEKTPEVSRISIEDALFTGILAELADVRRVNAFSYIRTYGWVLFLPFL